jgi:hypothetical protein
MSAVIENAVVTVSTISDGKKGLSLDGCYVVESSSAVVVVVLGGDVPLAAHRMHS